MEGEGRGRGGGGGRRGAAEGWGGREGGGIRADMPRVSLATTHLDFPLPCFDFLASILLVFSTSRTFQDVVNLT